ncbi:hypothetical protein IUZ16_001039 [Salmonella enterica]|nr:hypothetical protein [Salmonella enterica]
MANTISQPSQSSLQALHNDTSYHNADYGKETMDAVTINISQTKCCH